MQDNRPTDAPRDTDDQTRSEDLVPDKSEGQPAEAAVHPAPPPEEDPSAPDTDVRSAQDHHAEMSLLLCVQRLLRDNGMNYSVSAIRDLPALSQGLFDPKDAVSALSNAGFIASAGEMKTKDITQGHCPLIAFTHRAEAFLITDASDPDQLQVIWPGEAEKEEAISRDDAASRCVDFVILAFRKPEVKANANKENWFWGSLKQSRWLYIQVLIAAAVSNILGLSTALFIMVVYDRVVPNEAIESLIALTIGVLLALGFDFLIKTLRGNFIDRAGQRADARMSRLIFDKLLNMQLDKRKEKSGALASVVREFETLREFFTSATSASRMS